MKKVISVIGARPQFVKAATISRVFAESEHFEEILVHTGQHFDEKMSDIFFSELGIPKPHINLAIHGGNHGEMTGRMLGALEEVLIEQEPQCVLVYGDTNSTLAAALGASKLHIPVAHVEAGLRSFNRSMPEEINRVVTDHLSAQLFCPTSTALQNLANEGITLGAHHVGDVMFDATIAAKKAAEGSSSVIVNNNLEIGNFDLATIHRAENTNDREALAKAIDFLKLRNQSRTVVLPLHPRTEQSARKFGLDFGGLTIIEPVGYLDMTALLSSCCEVVTDSGGVQKEAYFHRKRCTTMRDETEWVETVAAGWNRLWDGPDYVAEANIVEYGDGKSAEKIVEILTQNL